jgi:hypothetical protein
MTDNITWPEGAEWCAWKGVIMTPEECMKQFGCDEELYIDTPEVILIGDVIYCSSIQGLITYLKGEIGIAIQQVDDLFSSALPRHREPVLRQLRNLMDSLDFENIRPIENASLLNMEALREFTKDLENHYATPLYHSTQPINSPFQTGP